MNDVARLELVEAQLLQREFELQQSKKSLTRFTYAISHELNSPIRMLNSLLDILNEDHKSPLDEEGVELLNMIRISAQRTQAIVNGIIEYSACCNPEIEHTRFDCQQVLDAAIDDLSALITDCAATITTGAMPWITSYPDALRKLFYQLINNALIYTSDDGKPPTVSVQSSESEEGIQFTIEDSGIGIAAEWRDRIFDPFERLNPKSHYEGAGLGLSQCREIVQALHGRIWVTSGEQGGSVFHVFLPNIETS